MTDRTDISAALREAQLQRLEASWLPSQQPAPDTREATKEKHEPVRD